ncbi:unnamed protein product [Closterium sp. NIES-65]|nr:unnamed protein product [Closterium sp. NIES-65]
MKQDVGVLSSALCHPILPLTLPPSPPPPCTPLSNASSPLLSPTPLHHTYSPLPLSYPSPPPLSPTHFPHPSPPPLSPMHFPHPPLPPHPFPPRILLTPFPHPPPSPTHFPHPSPPPLSPMHFPHPSPPPPTPFPHAFCSPLSPTHPFPPHNFLTPLPVQEDADLRMKSIVAGCTSPSDSPSRLPSAPLQVNTVQQAASITLLQSAYPASPHCSLLLPLTTLLPYHPPVCIVLSVASTPCRLYTHTLISKPSSLH